MLRTHTPRPGRNIKWGLVRSLVPFSLLRFVVANLWLAVFFVVWGHIMFDMDEFAQNPTMDKLERCTKADLFLIASFFDVSIPLNARKVEIKSCLSQRLVEKGVIKVAKLQSVPVSEGLNEFKTCLPENIVVYLNEQKVESLSKAAVCADEFVLTHRVAFPSARREHTPSPGVNIHKNPKLPTKSPQRPNTASPDSRECFYCHVSGHLIASCPALQRKEANQGSRKPKSVGFVQSIPAPTSVQTAPALPAVSSDEPKEDEIDELYRPFITEGSVSLTGEDKDQIPVTILRDSGANQSLLLRSVLPFSCSSFCGSDALLWGVKMSTVRAPLHSVFLRSPLVTGPVKLGLRSRLPIQGVDLILGNDLAGKKIFPTPEVVENPVPDSVSPVSAAVNPVFPACVVTRAQSRKFGDVMNLADSFMFSPENKTESPLAAKPVKNVSMNLLPAEAEVAFEVDRSAFIAAQQSDPTLVTCLALATAPSSETPRVYAVVDGVLVRNWFPPAVGNLEWNVVQQLVVPQSFRSHVLSLAHDNLSGHLGIKKTYHRIMRYFYWPGLKSDVTRFCRSCHVCQVSGKPNQIIPPAPLQPIPVLGEPFEHLILDCVGPLPKTKSGHQYLLTLVCAATRYPEAIPLRTLKAKAVVKALTNFFSTFGLPKYVQTDQGSNFMCKLFAQVLASLSIKHRKSSAYHPQSQGALERFHQTLKSMMRKYCLENEKDWDEGLPFLLLAARESVQESTGFSPAELVFGHTVRGPLRLLREQFLSETDSPSINVLDYVSKFRERLHKARDAARSALTETQAKMKKRFDKKSVRREFQVGEEVLALLPMSGAALQAKFCGPYVIEEKLGETDYVVRTPDRRRKSRVCHVNMLKQYVTRHAAVPPPVSPAAVATVAAADVTPSQYAPQSDGLSASSPPCSRLKNSEIMRNLSAHLEHLDASAQTDIIQLIENYPTLFSDTPSRTTVLSHDVDVENHPPIKQHAYRANPTKRSLLENEVEYLLENGLAVPSSSAWSSPCLLVPKSDRTPRFCTDYRKVNNVTKADSYPLPRMEDCVDRVGSATYVTKLDLLKGYWQVPLTPRASEISAFVTPDSFLQYTVMPFGLRNAPATFQRLMHIVLANVKNCEVYLDDVVAYSDTWSEHVTVLKEIFKRLKDANLTLNLAKCEFGKATVTYLGKQVGQGHVRPVDVKVQAIVTYPVPQTRRELRRFLGMAGYYRSFCRNFAEVVAPLTSLTSEKKPFAWSPACQHAFESCKALLCSTPVLTAPSFTRPFKLEVDASASGAGAVLLQEDKQGIDHPICYFSKKFSAAQLNYSTVEKEALSLLFALQHFEVYIGSSPLPVVVYTDHNPLVFLNRMQNANQRLMRWSLLVQDFNLEIHHKKGTDNVLADALSRV
ncbi:uncharacterized protein LOC126397732 [Epinephelus moara]|uniref:uncharacterized protein LOC126397732 n=1 Tax=Epinephelus moara TaxID=300413 RepID=UPI00214E254D|nr:uncharacterized protein LOC126397732 [Epinephelus moara]